MKNDEDEDVRCGREESLIVICIERGNDGSFRERMEIESEG